MLHGRSHAEKENDVAGTLGSICVLREHLWLTSTEISVNKENKTYRTSKINQIIYFITNT